MYTFKLDNTNKTITIKCTGFFKKEEAEEFLVELQQNIASITPANFDLIIDARNQKPSSPDVLPLQEKAMDIYLKTPFRKRYSLEFDSAITKTQINRLGKTDLLNKFTFVESLEEATK